MNWCDVGGLRSWVNNSGSITIFGAFLFRPKGLKSACSKHCDGADQPPLALRSSAIVFLS